MDIVLACVIDMASLPSINLLLLYPVDHPSPIVVICLLAVGSMKF